MAFAFPANPFNNQLYIDDLGQRWLYNFAQLRWAKDMNVINLGYEGMAYLTGDTHTISEDDHGRILLVDQPTGITINFPDDIPNNLTGMIVRLGAGSVSWDVESGLERKAFDSATEIAPNGGLTWICKNPTGTAAEIIFLGAMQ